LQFVRSGPSQSFSGLSLHFVFVSFFLDEPMAPTEVAFLL
jgi:hypothetical protein